MSFRLFRRTLRGAALFALLLLIMPAAWSGERPAPFSVVVDVTYGPEGGPESMRDALIRGILRELDREGCFASTARLRPGEETDADLLLRLVILDFEDRTEYEISLAQRDSPNAPPTERKRLTEKLSAQVRQEIWTLPDESLARVRGFKQEAAYRPLLNEDGSYEVELRLIDDLVRSTRSFACKGGAKKLSGEIERARTEQR